MVGWSRRNRKWRERRAAEEAKENACITSGCRCYCHKEREDVGTAWVWLVIFALCMYVGMLYLLGHIH